MVSLNKPLLYFLDESPWAQQTGRNLRWFQDNFGYAGYRKVAGGDGGNCYYRAFGFALVERLLLARLRGSELPDTVNQADLQLAALREKILRAKELVETLRPLPFVAFWEDAPGADPRTVGARVEGALHEFGGNRTGAAAVGQKEENEYTRHLEYLETVLTHFAHLPPQQAIVSFYQTLVHGGSMSNSSRSYFDTAVVMGMKAINAQYILDNAGAEFVAGSTLWNFSTKTTPVRPRQSLWEAIRRSPEAMEVRYRTVAEFVTYEVLPSAVHANDIAIRTLPLALAHTAYISVLRAETEEGGHGLGHGQHGQNGAETIVYDGCGRGGEVEVHLLFSDVVAVEHMHSHDWDIFYPRELFEEVRATEEQSIKPLVAPRGEEDEVPAYRGDEGAEYRRRMRALTLEAAGHPARVQQVINAGLFAADHSRSSGFQPCFSTII